MKLKSIFALFLCGLLVFMPVSAQTKSEQMQHVLAIAKSILSIPEEYTEFSYYAQTDTDGTVYWSFNWSGKNKGNVEATFCEDGFLVSYYAWVFNESNDGSLAKYTHRQAREIAEDFIRQVNPEIFPYLQEEAPDGEQRNSRTASFTFREYRDGIPAFANTVFVTVDKYHGIVRNYQSTQRIEGFSTFSAEITEEQAKQRYLHDIGICMEYRMYYDYQNKTYNVFPVYRLNDTSGKAIHALTGDVIEPYIPQSYLYRSFGNMMSDAMMKEESAEGGVQFTPEELNALANVGEVYSKEDALQIAIRKIPALEGHTLRSASLQRDYRDETKLFWYLDFQSENNDSYANVQMNAKTGQLLSFSLPQKSIDNTTFTKEDAKKIAEAFLANEASEVLPKTEYTEENNRNVSSAKEGGLPSSYFITYQRMENGIPVSGNYLTVRVDADTKQVGSYTRSFTEGLTFPDISTCMSEAEMFEMMDEKMNFLAVYLPTGEENQLAYTFLNPQSQMFDAYTGVVLQYDGSYITNSFIPEYSDISGHWAEEMILTLMDNGYYFSQSEFRPDEVITKKEFLKFFQVIGNDSEEVINKVIASIEGISAEEANADAVMTKEELCYYFMNRLGYQKVAQLDEIFQYPFPDEAEVSPSLKGDIAILTGLGVFKGSPDGHFYPTKQLTRAEAVSAVYCFLKNVQ